MDNVRLELGGQWSRSTGGRQIDFVNVPGGFAPMGECTLEREFQCDWPGNPDERIFLCTEGVLASARLEINGREIGVAGPWTPYRFELPRGLLGPTNQIRATIRDIIDEFGPTPGRRFDAGLVRPIHIERRPRAFLEDIHFRAQLSEDLSSAECTVVVSIDGTAAEPVSIELVERDTGRVVFTGSATAGAPARFKLNWPRLWSPESPNLYTLRATLPGKRPDVLTEAVGVRRLEVRGQDFFLNNQRLVLKGVCRHEFTSASGYSPSTAEVRRELALIKHAGFNYVRLVHSPQAPNVCRLAAEIGLLVSEEPGTCFHELGDEKIAAPAMECLRRTVKRDRNVPSILAWMIYNECNPNSNYAVRAAGVCRGLDPDCLLGMADCSYKTDDIKAMVQAANLSFYGINIYSIWPNDYCKIMKLYTDRPVVFTEWGGFFGQGNPRTLADLCEGFVVHSRPQQSLRVAGCAFWAWADYEEYSRPLPAAVDGWTLEGLIDRDGKPKADLQTLSMMCFEMDHPAAPAAPRVEVLCLAPRRDAHWAIVPLEKIGSSQERLEQEIDNIRKGQLRIMPWYMPEDPALPVAPRFGRLLVDGIEFACRDAHGPAYPLLLGEGCDEAVIPIGRRISALAVLGHVAFRGGFPSSTIYSVHHRDAESAKAFGDLAAEYEFVFDDGHTVQPLRHGMEILRLNDICRWWKTAPRTGHTKPAARTIINKTHEILRLDVWEHRLPQTKFLKEIRWRLKDAGAILLLHALSVQVEQALSNSARG